MNAYRKVKRAAAMIRSRGLGTLWNAVLTRYAQKRMPIRCPNQPSFAQIEITTHCNLHCETCRGLIDEMGPQMQQSRHMSFDEFKKVMSRLPHVRWACLNGTGEPLLNPELLLMIRYLSQRKVQVSFFTNAMLLKGKLAEDLVESGLATLKFSIDAADPAVFESIRKGAKMAEVVENIRNFAALVNRCGRTTPALSVVTTVTKRNAGEIPEIVKLVHSMGVNVLQLKRMIPWTATLNDDRVSGEELESIHRAREIARGLDVRLGVGPLLNRQLAGARRDPGQRNRICTWPWTGTYVTVDGSVTPCCNLFDPDKIKLGNIFEDDFREIWNGPRIRQLRSQLKTTLPEICRLACSADEESG
ncbi:MAG: radical SAM protein [Candidatus Eisenbacteria bacterium]